jgi:hypothetical protein
MYYEQKYLLWCCNVVEVSMSLKHICPMLFALCLGACDKAPADKAGARGADAPAGGAPAAKGAEAADAKRYACPDVGELSVDWTPAAKDTILLSLKLPEGFVHQEPSEGAGLAEFLKPITLADSGDKRSYRIFVTQTALNVDIRDKAKHPAYKMGTGFGEDGDKDIQTNLFVGDFDIDGRSVHVNRQPGDSGAIFEATFEEGGQFYIYGFAVSINNEVGAADMDATPCVADFDKIGLALLKSMKLIKK